MNGEGFAFAAWMRLMIAQERWCLDHDWKCRTCQMKWRGMQRATART